MLRLAVKCLLEWTFMAILVYIAELLLFECYLVCLDSTLPFNRR